MPLFDSWPERYANWFATPIGALVREIETRWVLDLLQPTAGERILDAGCGSGLFTAPLLERSAQVTGLDLSLPMLRHARAALPSGKFAPLAGDLCQLPFAGGRFDRSVSVTALEFVADGRRALAELFRVTRPGGWIVVATLNRLGPWAERRGAAARADTDSVFRHAHFRSPADLAALAPVEGRIVTAIHFPKETDPIAARGIEAAGQAEQRDTGAFVIGCWRKP